MNLIEQLKRDEGVRLTAYKDTMGLWTVGVGCLLPDPTNPKWEGHCITPQKCEDDLIANIAKHTADLLTQCPWTAKLMCTDPVRFAVLQNMSFNLGNKLFQFKNTLAAFERGDWIAASQGMLNSLWAKQVGPRAQRLADQVITGQWK